MCEPKTILRQESVTTVRGNIYAQMSLKTKTNKQTNNVKQHCSSHGRSEVSVYVS